MPYYVGIVFSLEESAYLEIFDSSIFKLIHAIEVSQFVVFRSKTKFWIYDGPTFIRFKLPENLEMNRKAKEYFQSLGRWKFYTKEGKDEEEEEMKCRRYKEWRNKYVIRL